MSTTWGMTPVAFPCLPTGSATGLSLHNPGTTTIYVDDSTNVTAGISTPLNPQATLQWRANVPLWALCDSGNTGTLLGSDSAGIVWG